MAGGNSAARGGPSGFLWDGGPGNLPGGSHGNHCGRRNMTRAKALRLRSIIESAVQGLDRDTAIEAIGLHPKWAEGSYKAGHAVQHQSNLWKCLQDHDSTGNPAWRPGSAPSLWGAWHARSAALALPWVAPTGAHDAYQAGEFMVWTDGAIYKCLADATVWGPDVVPGAWEVQG